MSTAPVNWSSVRVLVGIPLGYSGIEPETMRSVVDAVDHLRQLGATVAWTCRRYPFAVSTCRGLLAADFLASDADWLLSVDADMSFEPDVVERLIARALAGAEIIGVAARVKQVDAGALYAAAFAPEHSGQEPDQGAVRVLFVGAALLLVGRGAMQRVADAHPRLRRRLPIESGSPVELLDVYDPMTVDGDIRAGEDASFCLRARALGIETWCLVDAPIAHHGAARNPWTGNFLDLWTHLEATR